MLRGQREGLRGVSTPPRSSIMVLVVGLAGCNKAAIQSAAEKGGTMPAELWVPLGHAAM